MIANFALLFIELWVLSWLVLVLHWHSPRYGLTPLLVLLVAIVAILCIFSPIGVYVRVSDELYFTFAGNVFIPIILFAVLIIYVANGTTPTRMVIYSIIGAQIFISVVTMSLKNHLSLEGGGNFSGATPSDTIFNAELRTTFAS